MCYRVLVFFSLKYHQLKRSVPSILFDKHHHVFALCSDECLAIACFIMYGNEWIIVDFLEDLRTTQFRLLLIRIFRVDGRVSLRTLQKTRSNLCEFGEEECPSARSFMLKLPKRICAIKPLKKHDQCYWFLYIFTVSYVAA